MFKYECDSRKIEKGQTFIAIKGLTVDGHDYIKNAIENGAKKIICEHDINFDIDYEIVNNTEKWLKETLKKEYGNTIDKLKLIGITGTNGKTTSCYLTYQMLLSLGVNCAYIGTIGFHYRNEFIPLNNTTPDVLTIYKLLYHAYENGCETVVMEVSSQALSYDRLFGINFSVISFTNLTEDHLDYHKTMENYLNAKLLILNHLKKGAIITANCDDNSHIKFKKEKHKFLTFGSNGDYKILNTNISPINTILNFTFNNNKYTVTVPLANKFNVYNYLTMLSIVNNYGFKIEDIINNTSNLKAPKGRCEGYFINNGFAIVDYAHTPDAVEKVITAYNEIKKNKVITIIGCGGDRDPKKRPIMGEISTRLSDYVILTNDNPRTEDPNLIMNDIVSGIKTHNYEIIFDRKEAIKKGIDMINEGDILLILGKGHENYQIIGKEKYHLDDAEEILKYKNKK